MRVHGPLPATTSRAASPLRLTAAHALDLPGHSPLAADPDLRTFTADLSRPYGVRLDEDALTGARGQSYATLARHAIDALTGPTRPVDLLLMVYATPDVRPGQAVALHLAESCPGEPLAFAICDEGAGCRVQRAADRRRVRPHRRGPARAADRGRAGRPAPPPAPARPAARPATRSPPCSGSRRTERAAHCWQRTAAATSRTATSRTPSRS